MVLCARDYDLRIYHLSHHVDERIEIHLGVLRLVISVLPNICEVDFSRRIWRAERQT